MFKLTNKKALVTGGSRGIGRGIVLALAQQGADVAINYYDHEEDAQEVAHLVEETGHQAIMVKADVSDLSQINDMFQQINKEWSKLDILVNNAGVIRQQEFDKVTQEDWDAILNVNLRGQFFCAQQAARLMKHGTGRIINISSISSGGVGVAFPQIAPYTASKGGVVALTENLAVDLGSKGISVNSVAPGVIETDMSKPSLKDKAAVDAFMARIPKGRIGKPSDIAAAVAFLASDEAEYINGTVIYVDGGWLSV